MTRPDARTSPLDVALIGEHTDPAACPDLRRLRRRWTAPDGPDGLPPWLAVASVRGRVLAFACAVPTPYPFPHGHPAARAVRTLGPDRRDELLAGGLEITEVLVDPAVRRRGLATAVLRSICTPARRGRAWTALAGARGHRGWRLVTGPDQPVVALAPAHPARRVALPPPAPAGPWAPFVPGST